MTTDTAITLTFPFLVEGDPFRIYATEGKEGATCHPQVTDGLAGLLTG